MRKSKNRGAPFILAGLCALAISTELPVSSASARDVGVTAAINDRPQDSGSRTSGPRRAKARDTAERAAPQYFIEFRSRYALSYGHTFALHGLLNERGDFAEFEVAGLHPAGESSVPWTVGHVVPVPAETGASDGDLEDDYISGRYRVLLSEEQYATVAAFIAQLKASSPVWHAALYNCNAFVATIAQSMGMQTPFTWLPPEQFIADLRAMNEHLYAPAPMPPLVPGHVAAPRSGYTATSAPEVDQAAAAAPDYTVAPANAAEAEHMPATAPQPPDSSTALVLLPFER